MKRVNRNVTKDTDNSRVYKMATRNKTLGCTLCPPNKGCNGLRFGFNNNWKEKRKTQYKNNG